MKQAKSTVAHNEYGVSEIKAARIAKGITGPEMAAKLGLTTESYYRRERGRTYFTIKEIPILAKELDLTPEQISAFLFDGKLPVGTAES